MASTGIDRSAAQRRRTSLRVGLLAAVGVVLVVTGIGVVTEDDPAEAGRAAPTGAPSADAATVLPPTRLKPSPSSSPSPHPASGVPTRVAVRRLAIDVPVVPIAPEGGVLVPPDNPRELGWYQFGARPGAVQGSAVITGHTVHTGGGALDELDDLRTGDTVRVSTAQGTIGYRVSEVSILSKTQFAKRAQKVFSSTVPGRLVLITCTDWNGEEYLSNTLVYADPAPAN